MKSKKKSDKGKNEKNLDPLLTIDSTILENSVQVAINNSRFAAWSPPGKAMLEYLAETTPRFSQSKEVATHLEQGLKKKYPEMWEEVQKRLIRSQDAAN